MKVCKSCRKEIEEQATKCPYCQSFQTWKKNPQFIAMIFPILFIPLIFLIPSMVMKERHFSEYKQSFHIELVNKIEANSKVTNIYRIDNISKYQWSWIHYQLIGKQADGKIVAVSSKSETSWVLPAKSSALLSVEIEANPMVTNWCVEIVDMHADRF